ncbi:MAG: hypothetical protein ACQETB_10320 [Halobacteriota archaeon]
MPSDTSIIGADITTVALKGRDRYFRIRLAMRELRNRIRYDAPPPIYDPILVDPEAITDTISWTDLGDRGDVDRPAYFDRRKPSLAGTVVGGDWDTSLRKFEACVVYRSFVAHFEENTPWEATSLFRQAAERFEHGDVLWGCSSVTEFADRCEKLDRLFERVKTDGYKSQSELAADATLSDPTRCNRVHRTIENEILVHIGRDGQFIFTDGRNRLSIAKILGVEEVPVTVLVRHDEWQQRKEAIARGDTDPSTIPPTMLNHPDVVGLLEDR